MEVYSWAKIIKLKGPPNKIQFNLHLSHSLSHYLSKSPKLSLYYIHGIEYQVFIPQPSSAIPPTMTSWSRWFRWAISRWAKFLKAI